MYKFIIPSILLITFAAMYFCFIAGRYGKKCWLDSVLDFIFKKSK